MTIRSTIAKFAAEMAALSPVRDPIEVHLPPAFYRVLLGEIVPTLRSVDTTDWVQRGNPLKKESIYLHTESGLVLVAKIEGYTEELTP